MYDSFKFHEEMEQLSSESSRVEGSCGGSQGMRSAGGGGYGRLVGDDEADKVLYVKDVPIYIKFNSVSSTCTSTAPSTPNSRDFDRAENGRGASGSVLGVSASNPPISQFGRMGDDGVYGKMGGGLGGSLGCSKGGIWESSNMNMQLFNFRIVRRRHYSGSSSMFRSYNRVHIEVTRPSDFSFLLNSDINDGGDFLYLKSEQRLLVDFQEFPIMLVDLLNRSKGGGGLSEGLLDDRTASCCKTAERETVFPGISRYDPGVSRPSFSPSGADGLNSLKIVLSMSVSEGGELPYLGLSSGVTLNSGILSRLDSCVLHFVELNHYKEIVHLSLPFETANEAYFRDYTLRHLNHYFDLSNRQQRVISNYEAEIESLKREVRQANESLSRTSYLSAQKEREISEKFQTEIKRISERYESDYSQLKMIYEDTRKRELEHWNQERLSSEDKINDLQQQFDELGTLFSELSESKSSLEKYIRDDREASAGLKTKLDAVQSSYDILSRLKEEQEQELNDLKLKYSSSLDSNKALKDELEQRKKEVDELDAALDDACKEIEKGNQIISSLQTSLGNVDSKYKQQMTNFSNLKRSFQQMESRSRGMEERLKDYEQSLEDSNSRQEQLIEENERLRKILIEAERQIEINQGVISSLKRQMSMSETGFYGRDGSLGGGFAKSYSKAFGDSLGGLSGGGGPVSSSMTGVHYSLGNLQPAVASVSASRSSYLCASSAKPRRRAEATFDSNSFNRKYSMSVQPRRSQTWTMESVNHEPRFAERFEVKSQKRGAEGAGTKLHHRNSGSIYYRDFQEGGGVHGVDRSQRKALETIDENASSIFTPPNNRQKPGGESIIGRVGDSGNSFRGDVIPDAEDPASLEGVSREASIKRGGGGGYGGGCEMEELLFGMEEAGESFERSAKELTTPRLKTPTKPVRAGS
ncbi:coiled coil-containing protein [Cryptosporidium canis]|uniref:Coiled coil-containing protein n=1 Tax=Cryptosporidium canis TaxID=195482 RepID=A0ABQ8P955_9CRYT|nr:coiled coil-containing protein [Cryptosporidium canis]